MKFINAKNFVFFSVLALALMPGEDNQVTGFPITMFVLLPLLLLKIGLAAPIILAVLGKLLLLLLLKKKAIALPLLFSSSKTGTTDSYGSSEDLGRIKRSVDFVQSVVGNTELTEDQLLESILNIDTLRCGEKLLCEVAAAASKKKKVGEEEAAMISLFSENRPTASKEPTSKAVSVYRQSIIDGFKFRDCSTRYPTCPFDRSIMMHLVNLVTSSITEDTVQDIDWQPIVDLSQQSPQNLNQESQQDLKSESSLELPPEDSSEHFLLKL